MSSINQMNFFLDQDSVTPQGSSVESTVLICVVSAIAAVVIFDLIAWGVQQCEDCNSSFAQLEDATPV